jgi:F0F1-type ATP synthase assembly protein I
MKKQKSALQKYVLVSGFVFETLLVLFIGYVVGKWLDKLLNSSPLMIVLLLFTMSLYAVYHLIKIAGKLEE